MKPFTLKKHHHFRWETIGGFPMELNSCENQHAGINGLTFFIWRSNPSPRVSSVPFLRLARQIVPQNSWENFGKFEENLLTEPNTGNWENNLKYCWKKGEKFERNFRVCEKIWKGSWENLERKLRKWEGNWKIIWNMVGECEENSREILETCKKIWRGN